MSAPGISSSEKIQPLDVLAIAAHRDDVEQTCGGTLLKMAERGYRTGILDLTRGEMGTRGSAEDREREAAEAARILKTSWRGALDIPDGRVENTWENKLKVARVLREQRPRVVILPYWKGRHPDHYTASTLGYEACFLAGWKKLDCSAAVPAAVVADVPPATLRAGRPQSWWCSWICCCRYLPREPAPKNRTASVRPLRAPSARGSGGSLTHGTDDGRRGSEWP